MNSGAGNAGKRRAWRFGILVGMVAGLVFMPVGSAQEVNINNPVGGDVNGNGDANGNGSAGNPIGNTIKVNGVVVGGGVYGGSARSESAYRSATNNIVYLAPGSSAAYVGGGNASHDTESIAADNNSVTIDAGSGVIQYMVYGGQGNGPSSPGAASPQVVSASGNTVTIESGTFTTYSIYGGYAHGGSGTANANGNTVVINGGTVAGDVYGGYAIRFDGTSGVNAFADNNTVTISGSPNLDAATLYGGYLYNKFGQPIDDAVFIGNTLNMKTAGVKAAGLHNFQTLNFYVPETLADGATVLTVTGVADVTGAEVNIGAEGGTALKAGDKITLVDANTLVGNATAGTGIAGIASSFEFTLDDTSVANRLVAIITDVGRSSQVDAQLKSLAESRMAGLGMLTLGADTLEMQVIPQLRALAPHASGLTTFGVAGGSTMRYKSGSHVDVDGFNLATGLGWNSTLDEATCANLMLGAFFEAGWGSYDSHNSFSAAPTVKGEGDSNYYGGGLLARYDTSFGLYTEGSFRIGSVDTDYNSNDFTASFGGRRVDFDSTSTYYGAHFGLGYVWTLTECASLDLYGKYHWTRQDGDSVTIRGDRVKFEEMDSHRVRAGARYSYALTAANRALLTPYVGAAYEREFDGKAKSTVNGAAVKAPDVKGGTGTGELGMAYKPSAESRFSADLGLQGYVGKREGVRGTLQLGWKF